MGGSVVLFSSIMVNDAGATHFEGWGVGGEWGMDDALAAITQK